MQLRIERTDGIIERLHVDPTRKGPLSGRTFFVKDLFDTEGRVTGAGNPDWKRTHPAAKKHAEAIQILLAAGATLIGITCSDEFAFSIDFCTAAQFNNLLGRHKNFGEEIAEAFFQCSLAHAFSDFLFKA